MAYFAILYEPGPGWLAGKPINEQPLARHTAYQRHLHEQGRSLFAGPFLDEESGGIAIVIADNAGAARELMANDPALTEGVLVARLRPWLAMVGSTTRPRVHAERESSAPLPDDAAARLALARAVLAAQPFSRMLGAEIHAFAPERTELQLVITEQLQQQAGFVHGGVLSYLADNVLTFAGGTVLGPDVVTAELKINYCRPATGERLVARGHVVSSGQTQAVVRCDIFATTGDELRLCAIAQGTIVRRG